MNSPYELLAGLALLRESKRQTQHMGEHNLESWSALLVRIGQKTYVLAQDDVNEILSRDKLTRVNGVKPWVLGVGFFQGRLLNVIDAFCLLDEENANTRSMTAMSRILVVQGDKEWFGLKIDELLGIHHVWSDNAASDETPEHNSECSSWNKYIVSQVNINNKNFPVLQVKQLIRELEMNGELAGIKH